MFRRVCVLLISALLLCLPVCAQVALDETLTTTMPEYNIQIFYGTNGSDWQTWVKPKNKTMCFMYVVGGEEFRLAHAGSSGDDSRVRSVLRNTITHYM